MSRPCPLYGVAISQDCVDCEDKECRRIKPYDKVIIGIDQSYKNTGVSVVVDGQLKIVRSIDLTKYDNNSERRGALAKQLNGLLSSVTIKAKKIVCIIERIRLRSQGFINIDYIKSIGALNATIIDVMYDYGVEVYSVDTRCWKAQVVGTSKGAPNSYGVPEEKWPTVQWLCRQGRRKDILICMDGTRKKKGIFVKDGHKWMFNNDAADSAGIAMFGVVGDKSKLEREK